VGNKLDGQTLSNPWYKEKWPWLLMLGPAAVIIAGAITIWLAIKTSDGLVEDDYYKQGLAVNQRMQRDGHAEALGISAEVMRSDLSLRIFLNGNEKFGFPEKIQMRITHPTRSGMDQNVMLEAEGRGMYVGKLTQPIAGRWHVAISDSANEWRLIGDWVTDQTEPLKMAAGVATSINRNVTGR
jgi:hypothetical protein